MSIFDAINLGTQARVFDGCSVSITIGGTSGPENAIRSIAPSISTEGVEHQYAFGKRKPFAKTKGVIKPGEITIGVYSASLQAVLQTIDSGGNWNGVEVDWEIILDEKSSPGLTAIPSILKLNTASITIERLTITGISASYEVGGGALVNELKGQCLDVQFMGLPGWTE